MESGNIEGLAFDLIKGILSESFGSSAFRSVLILADLILLLKDLAMVEKPLLGNKNYFKFQTPESVCRRTR